MSGVNPVPVASGESSASGESAAPGANATVRVVLPSMLRLVARVEGEVRLEVPTPVTARGILDALEARHPKLRGTIRDHETGRRRPLLRYYACREDLSHDPPDAPLPDAIARGEEPFLVVGSIAGG